MRWVSYASPEGVRVGVLAPGTGQIHAVEAGVALVDLLADGLEPLLAHGERALASPVEVVDLAGVRLLPPIPVPPAVRDCLGFLDHMRNCLQVADPEAELEDAWYRIPAFYFANPASVIGPFDDVSIAPGSAWFDVELEVAAIIGQGGRDLTPTEAEEAIVGYTYYLDWSARDLQILESQLKIGQAKGKDCATTLGPYLVTRDEVAARSSDGGLDLDVTLRINGAQVGGGNLAAMDWTFGEMISYASRGVELRPGDVFGSGTVPTGCLLEHFSLESTSFPGWLADGHEVVCSSDVLGETRQTVRASSPPFPLPDRPRPVVGRERAARVNPAGSYPRGLTEVAADTWAWLLPDGGYGWSNAGLVVGEGASLLVDTLFDLPLTAEMLEAMQPMTDRSPITHAVLTHSNGDHVYGNQLLDPEVTIIAAEATAEEMHHDPDPSLLAAVVNMDLGPLTAYARERFGPFDFGGITIRHPDETYTGELHLSVGGRELQVRNLGPAHTGADSVVFVPDSRVLYAGDLLFIGCTPVVWAGPISNWIAACDAMIALDPIAVVPGHGPITDIEGIRKVSEYLQFVSDYADQAHAAGQDFKEAAFAIDLGEYGRWLDAERIVVNVYRRYLEIDPETPVLDQLTLLPLTAEWDAARGI